jgi:hypothetical protein
MRKALIVAIFVSSLLIPLVAEAQPAPPNVDTLGPVQLLPPSGSVTIISPTNSRNYSNQVQLIFVVEAVGLLGQFGNVGVNIDGGVINSVTNFIEKSVVQSDADEQYWLRTTVLASLMLPSLSEGTHNVTVYYGWQYVAPGPQRYEVSAYASVIFVIVSAQATNVSEAESDISAYTKPEISISSPSNTGFNTNSLPLNFTLGHIHPLATEASVYYSLDGKDKISVFGANESRIDFVKNEITPFNLRVGNLTDGLHNLTVYAEITYLHYGLSSDFSSVQFTIDTSPPTISGLSIRNKTYNIQTIPLSFNVDENTSWVAYNLDNQGNVTVQGNITLTGLSDGSHSIVVYANDTLGNLGKSDTVFFTVNTPTTEDFTPTIVLSGMIGIVVAVSLLVYFKKRKHKT